MLPANDEYPVRECENWSFRIQIQLSLKWKRFVIFCFVFLFHFRKLHEILNILEKKMIVIPTLFHKLQTVKDLVRPLSEKHRFRTLFHSQRVKMAQTLVKSAGEQFHHVFSAFWRNLICKIFPLVICEILGLLGSILIANDKYPVWDCENLLTPVKMQLCSKQKNFSDFFVPFLEIALNFEHFEKMMIVIPTLFRNLMTFKDFVWPVSKKHRFRTLFEGQHVKGTQILVTCVWEDFHHIFSSLWGNVIWKIFQLVKC